MSFNQGVRSSNLRWVTTKVPMNTKDSALFYFFVFFLCANGIFAARLQRFEITRGGNN